MGFCVTERFNGRSDCRHRIEKRGRGIVVVICGRVVITCEVSSLIP